MKSGGRKEREKLLDLVRDAGHANGVVAGMQHGQRYGIVIGFSAGITVSWMFYQIWKGAGVWW